MKYKIFCAFIFLISFGTAFSQQNLPFWEEIQDFKKQDSIDFPKKNVILFVGSSSFRLWEGLEAAFPEKNIINRGFGGSKLTEVQMYADDIIFPYKPKQIVIYCGENDLTEEGITADSVFNRFKNLFHVIRGELKNVPIAYVSIKPSPSRVHLMTEMLKANQMIHTFLRQQKKAEFIDIYLLMLDESGSPRKDIFVEDMLHLNEKGYAIWAKAIKPYLK